MGRIFDIEAERAIAQRPRDIRPELSYPYPGGIYPLSPNILGRFGASAPYVSETQIRGLPAAWRCLNLLGNGVASMSPFDARDSTDHRTPKDAPTVFKRANATYDMFDWMHMGVCTAAMHGNFMALLDDIDADGYARQLIAVPTGFWYAHYAASGLLEYPVSGFARPFTSDEVFHVRAFSVPGSPMGIGVVENFRRSWGAQMEQQAMVADTYHSGAVPSGVITTDRPQQDRTQAKDIQEQWIDSHGGGQRKPAVLPSEWKFTPLTWSPEDAQFLESRQYSVGETALMFNLDPSDVGASLAGAASSITYTNIEQREVARVTDSYGSWMRRFEEAFTNLAPAGTEAFLPVERRLRTDSKTRAEVHQLNIATQVETVDEARAAEGKPPLPKKDELPLEGAAPVAPPSPEQVPDTDIEVKPVSVKL